MTVNESCNSLGLLVGSPAILKVIMLEDLNVYALGKLNLADIRCCAPSLWFVISGVTDDQGLVIMLASFVSTAAGDLKVMPRNWSTVTGVLSSYWILLRTSVPYCSPVPEPFLD